MPIIDVGTDIHEYLATKKIVVADFWAEWCIPCKPIDEALTRISQMFKHRKDIAFIRVNVDKFPDVAADFEVFNLPTVIVFYNGKEVKRFTSVHGFEAQLYKVLKSL